ncbi:hypothetical protein OG871_39820 (plasmid) [Kitasatospora sp. NBC_00374]|uniref:hypothetical protein n=1 Tax=Kitasatospora sp. NBC_00374 TaxID=2975964 RepID=UPI002F9161E6
MTTPDNTAAQGGTNDDPKDILTAALELRAQEYAAADRKFWTTVDGVIKGGVPQVAAANALGYTRETVRKQLKRWVSDDPAQSSGDC